VTTAQWRSAKVKPAVRGGFEGTPATFADYLDEFGNKTVLIPEIKSTAAADVPAICAMARERGLTKSVIFQSFSFSVCQAIVAEGFQALYLFAADPTETGAQIKAAGINFVGPNTSIATAVFTEMKNAGLKVFAYGAANTKADAASILSKGADGMFSDDPWWVSGRYPHRTSDPFKEGRGWPFVADGFTYYTGTTGVWGQSPVELAGGNLYFPVWDATTTPSTTSAGGVRTMAMDWAGPINTPCIIKATFELGANGVTGNGFGFVLWTNSNYETDFYDQAQANQNGLQMMSRRNGQLAAWQYINGAAASSIGSTTVPSPVMAADGIPVTVTLMAEITDTSLTLVNPDKGFKLTATHSRALRGARFGIRGANGTDMFVRDVSIRQL